MTISINRTPRKKFEIWFILSFAILGLYCLFLLYPLGRLFISSVWVDGHFSIENFRLFFSQSYYYSTIKNSLKIAVSTTAITLILGFSLAYLYTMYEIKGKAVLQVIIILCSMSAPFISAYSWILLMGRNGLIRKIIETIFSVELPTIYGFGGILLVLSLQMFPLVFLYVSGALKNIDNSLLEASANLGIKGFPMIMKVVIPLCMPTILAAGLLVFMKSFADFGTPLLIGEGYLTFPVLIYRQYFGETGSNANFAAALCIIAILITGMIFAFQKWLNGRYRFTMNSLHPITRKKARGIKNMLIHVFCYGVVAIAYLPHAYVIYTSFKNTSGKIFVDGYSMNSYKMALFKYARAIPNTFYISIISLALVVILAIIIAYLVVRRSNTLNRAIDVCSMIPYIMPGSVVGIALVMSFNKRPLVLTGTVIIMIIALIIRRIPYTIRSSVATLQQISPSVEEASLSLGVSRMKTFFGITVPMMSNGILSGAILSWITIMTELSTGIILYTNKTMTITLAIYNFVTRGSYGYAAAFSAILTMITILTLAIFLKFSKNGEITF